MTEDNWRDKGISPVAWSMMTSLTAAGKDFSQAMKSDPKNRDMKWGELIEFFHTKYPNPNARCAQAARYIIIAAAEGQNIKALVQQELKARSLHEVFPSAKARAMQCVMR